MSDKQPRLNRYTCQACRESIVTVDADTGTTPFMLGCRATDRCNGMMHSSFYRGVTGVPSFAWRKPTRAEYTKAGPAMRHHFDLGGLDIYPLEATDDAG